VAGAEAEAEDGRASEAEGVPLTLTIKLLAVLADVEQKFP